MSSSRVLRPEAIATAVARRVRRLPGGPKLAGRAAGRLRDSRLARKVVSRVFDVNVTRVGGTVFLSGGNVLAGHGLDNLPVVLVSLVGADADDVPELLETVAREQVITAGFRPVIVLDSDHFAEVRQYGYPVDFVVPSGEWTDQEVPWGDYFATRIAAMRRHYQAVGAVELTEPGEFALAYLQSFVRD